MINKETALEMQKICRSCMCEGEEMRSMFATKNLQEGQTVNLADMLMACTSVQVASDDGLPIQLCLTCETKLDTAFEFKQQCEKTDVALREITNQPLSKSSIKEEQLDIVVQPDLVNTSDLYSNVADSDDSSPELIASPKKRSKDSNTFTCGYCQKVLRTKKGLTIHQRRHTGEKLRSCHLCDANFTRTNHLRRHLETHNRVKKGTNSYSCNECGENFSKAYHLVKHKKEHKLGNINIKKETSTDGDDSQIIEDADDGNFEIEEESIDNDPGSTTNNSLNDTELDDDDKSKMLRSDREKKVMECEFCDRKFKYRKSFNHHMQTEHGMSDESDVPLSTYVTKQDQNLKIESSENNVSEIIPETFETKDFNAENTIDGIEGLDDTDLLISANNRKMHSCHVCESKFARANHLTRHMTLHRAILIHKCDRCDKAFATPEYLAKHFQEDHIDKPYVCSKCNKPFSRGEHLIRHLKVHETNNEQDDNLKCSICEKVFTRTDHLSRHTKVHLQQDKRHICAECGKAFNRIDNLKTHQRIHAGLKDNARVHLCIYCGKDFNNSSNMIVHMRRHTGERPYKCTICGKGFPRSHDLKCHERTHSGEKPYLCTLCGKSFNKSNKLLRHNRVHTGERPYVCNLCGRAFTQSNDLALHMRRHTGARPYACGVCPARFIQSGQLKSHRRSTNHWMDTQPDLKGGHRVELVTPITNPAPIKFKTHGKNLPKLKPEEMEMDEFKEPRILNHTVGIMGNISIQNDNDEGSQPIIIESTKLFQQFHNAGFVGLSSVIDAANQGASCSDIKEDSQNFTIAHVVQETATGAEEEKNEVANNDDIAYSTVSASTYFPSPDRHNYQNYG